MARKKKCNIMFIILGVLIALLIASLLFKGYSGNEGFININKENFDTMREKNTCGSCST